MGRGDCISCSLLCKDVAATSLQRKVKTISLKYPPKPNTLSAVVRNFKSAVTKQCHDKSSPSFQWHHSFHDTIIRSEKQLIAIREYIRNNPGNWANDPENIMK